jgi:hypothetical protein
VTRQLGLTEGTGSRAPGSGRLTAVTACEAGAMDIATLTGALASYRGDEELRVSRAA